jgi:hypothetical protein
LLAREPRSGSRSRGFRYEQELRLSDREKCLRLLTGFVRTGDIDKGATAAAMIVN